MKKIPLAFFPLIVVHLGAFLLRGLFAGNRGMIIHIFVVLLMAFVLSGRKIGSKHVLFGGCALAVLILFGMIFGTSFRMVKGSESQVGVTEYIDKVGQTFEEIQEFDAFVNVSYGVTALMQRIDIVSTLAVVVSNHEKLKPYEAAYDLDGNIYTDLSTFLIPRVLWPDKPIASDARRYSDLYFNTDQTSFALTPFGDLLRNYGLIGVPIGMLFIGIILRFTYSGLVAGQATSIWKYSIYFMLVTSISYEGFYGTIIPNLLRILLTAVFGVVVVLFFANHFKGLGQFFDTNGRSNITT
jgi:hypothetical protein